MLFNEELILLNLFDNKLNFNTEVEIAEILLQGSESMPVSSLKSIQVFLKYNDENNVLDSLTSYT